MLDSTEALRLHHAPKGLDRPAHPFVPVDISSRRLPSSVPELDLTASDDSEEDDDSFMLVVPKPEEVIIEISRKAAEEEPFVLTAAASTHVSDTHHTPPPRSPSPSRRSRSPSLDAARSFSSFIRSASPSPPPLQVRLSFGFDHKPLLPPVPPQLHLASPAAPAPAPAPPALFLREPSTEPQPALALPEDVDNSLLRARVYVPATRPAMKRSRPPTRPSAMPVGGAQKDQLALPSSSLSTPAPEQKQTKATTTQLFIVPPSRKVRRLPAKTPPTVFSRATAIVDGIAISGAGEESVMVTTGWRYKTPWEIREEEAEAEERASKRSKQ
ncbi:hypothetical protein MNV49_007116 [Pseudohyphozyma bogoriensis]|nr:hypothetical protein MNV49_007116 [Pseudohyphozyma bogoriensis]